MLPTPKIPHDLDDGLVYPPSEDSFLLIDTLAEYWQTEETGKLILEIGAGSGIVTAFLSSTFPQNAYFAVDINPYAAATSKETLNINDCSADILLSEFGRCFRSCVFDTIICNPPYVPGEDSNYPGVIDFAWNGGLDGMTFFKQLLPIVVDLLAPCGIFVCVLLRDKFCLYAASNSKCLKDLFSSVRVLRSGKTAIESLVIVEFVKK